MKFSVDKQEKVVSISLQEEKLNSLTAPKLKSELIILREEGYRNIVFDLSEVKFVDSSGLSSILVGNRICKEAGGTFVICGLNEQVQKLIKISQLENILSIFLTKSEAIDYALLEELERDLKQ
ncbi:MAG: STAS domain-containing protein [Chitinophagales bacterium]